MMCETILNVSQIHGQCWQAKLLTVLNNEQNDGYSEKIVFYQKSRFKDLS